MVSINQIQSVRTTLRSHTKLIGVQGARRTSFFTLKTHLCQSDYKRHYRCSSHNFVSLLPLQQQRSSHLFLLLALTKTWGFPDTKAFVVASFHKTSNSYTHAPTYVYYINVFCVGLIQKRSVHLDR